MHQKNSNKKNTSDSNSKGLIIKYDYNLKKYNTFGVPTIAQSFVTITSPEQLQKLLDHPVYKNSKKYTVLGGGSNILFTQDRFDGLVIYNNISGKDITLETDRHITLTIGAGENWDKLVQWSVDNDFAGLENLKSIPGSVGAAPIQNIGAYGVEVKDVIKTVTYIDITTGTSKTLSNTACKFGYRDSIFKNSLKNKAFVTHVTFTLSKFIIETYKPILSYPLVEEKATQITKENNIGYFTPKIIAQAIHEIRTSKLPDYTTIGTAGSFFKNPLISEQKAQTLQKKYPSLKLFTVIDEGKKMIKLSAGQLIEFTGFKGKRQGAVGTYKNHALVIINHGNGTGKEIQAFAQDIQEAVKTKFNITLIPEVTHI